MQKYLVHVSLAMIVFCTSHTYAQYSEQDSTYHRWYVGSTLFMLGNFATVNPPGFAQLNVGYRLTRQDALSVEFITWKYAWPLGINPFLNSAYGNPEEQYPGYIRDYGVGVAYQHYFWEGLYAAAHVMPMWQTFVNEIGAKVANGFHVFTTLRIGYHVKLFSDRLFIEPSLGVAGRVYHTEMPAGFREKDNKWSKFTPEPGLHIGMNF